MKNLTLNSVVHFLFLHREVVINFLQLAIFLPHGFFYLFYQFFFFSKKMAIATPDTVFPGMLEDLGIIGENLLF